jgi:DNA-binding NarL/FixJ family response regulator
VVGRTCPLPESISLLGRTHAASVNELRALPENSRHHLEDRLVRRGLPSGAGEHRNTTLGSLTPRQRDVAELVWDALSNATIGRMLALAEGTAKKHVSRIRSETGCRSRTELTLCLRSGSRS